MDNPEQNNSIPESIGLGNNNSNNGVESTADEIISLPVETEASPTNDSIEYNGSWENNHRSIIAAAVTALIGVGAVYFNVQTILVLISMAIYQAFEGGKSSGNIFDQMNEMATSFKIPVLIALLISQYFLMLLPALWIVKKWHTTDVKKYIRVKLIPFKEIILSILITLSLLPLCYFISDLLLDLLGVPDSFRDTGEHLFTAKSLGQFIFLIFVVAVTPAICEEVFFRGYFQRTIERKAGAKSFIIGGVLFGMFHFQPLGLIPLSILGILFSFLYYRSKSLLVSSAAHFTNNFVVLVLLYASPEISKAAENIHWLWVILSLSIAAILMWVYLKVTQRNYSSAKVSV